ncbi:DEAD-box ATP-dependent RNA helicase 37 [Capsicum annuum]|nr:DEAD-box ATP-dependent RNA helicase 37 [Capsicum annuum]
MSWADSVSAAENLAGAPPKSAYVPPHLRNRPSADPPAQASYAGTAAFGNDHGGYGVPNVVGSRWSGQRNEYQSGFAGGGGRGGGWNSRSGGWDRGRDREVNPFKDADSEVVGEQESSAINFDAYEDIPVETSGENVPPPVNTFSDIDLGEAVDENIRRCKYVKPTPVQRHTIPISLAGRDLMACAQTGSGKTAAFCFPIISGIMRGQFPRPPRPRMAFPLALILSPTRELSCQIHDEAKKFSYQTGVKVVVAYGGAPINQQFTVYAAFSGAYIVRCNL